VWYVDGKEVARYSKSTDKSILDQGQWPFDKHFHLILNQSVGNNAWAANADITHTYETRFDWVRVYQKPGMKNTQGTVTAVDAIVEENEPLVEVVDGGVKVSVAAPETILVYDLAGRVVVERNVVDTACIALKQGAYVVCGKTVLVK
jgi:beta-glucanase (GH16 family)